MGYTGGFDSSEKRKISFSAGSRTPNRPTPDPSTILTELSKFPLSNSVGGFWN